MTTSCGTVRDRMPRRLIMPLAAMGALTFVMQAGVGSDAPVAPRLDADRPAPSVSSEQATSLAEAEALTQETRWFNNRPVRAARVVHMKVTAYSPDERSCGSFADGLTASGYSVMTNGGNLVAADTDLLPLGTLLSIPGYDGGAIVPVLDRGGRIRGNRLDALFPTHSAARRWGVQELSVTIWEYADGLPRDFEVLW